MSDLLGLTREAAFRGVKFFIASTGSAFGRRVVSHEFPLRDTPYTEDLGRKQQTFTIEGFVLGPTSSLMREALLRACEKEGPGELVHPFLGTKRVVCTSCQLNESSEERGIARFTLSFVEAGSRGMPGAGLDPTGALSGAADALSAASGADFESGFSLLNAPGFVVNAAITNIDRASSYLQGIASSVPGNPIAVARLLNSIARLKSSVNDLVKSPANLRKSLTGILKDLTDALKLENPFERKRAEKARRTSLTNRTLLEAGLVGKRMPAAPRTSPNKIRIADNQDAFVRLIRTESLTQAAREAVVSGVFETQADIIATRDALLVEIDVLTQAPPSVETYDALEELRAQIIVGLPVSSDLAPAVVPLTPRDTLPVLPLLFDLLGNALSDETRIESFVARNPSIRHPGFVRGGVTLAFVDDEGGENA